MEKLHPFLICDQLWGRVSWSGQSASGIFGRIFTPGWWPRWDFLDRELSSSPSPSESASLLFPITLSCSGCLWTTGHHIWIWRFLFQIPNVNSIPGCFLCADKITQVKNDSSPKITQAIFEITQGLLAKKKLNLPEVFCSIQVQTVNKRGKLQFVVLKKH